MEHLKYFSGIYSDSTWASINLGGNCNSFCKFCYTEWTRNRKGLSTKEAELCIETIRKVTKLNSIIFTGGEPMLRKDLQYLFQYASKTGFSNIYLQTQGNGFENIKTIKVYEELGLKGVLMSLHGPKTEIHDAITRRRGSFNQAIAAIENIELTSVDLTINIVLCKKNYMHIEETIIFLRNILRKNNKVRLSYPIIEGAAYDNIEEVCVSFEALLPELSKAIANALDASLKVEIFGLPLCLIKKYLPSVELINTIEENSNLLSASVFNRDRISRGDEYIKLQACKNCSLKNTCSGIQLEYIKLYPASYKFVIPIGA